MWVVFEVQNGKSFLGDILLDIVNLGACSGRENIMVISQNIYIDDPMFVPSYRKKRRRIWSW